MDLLGDVTAQTWWNAQQKEDGRRLRSESKSWLKNRSSKMLNRSFRCWTSSRRSWNNLESNSSNLMVLKGSWKESGKGASSNKQWTAPGMLLKTRRSRRHSGSIKRKTLKLPSRFNKKCSGNQASYQVMHGLGLEISLRLIIKLIWWAPRTTHLPT